MIHEAGVYLSISVISSIFLSLLNLFAPKVSYGACNVVLFF